MRWLVIINRDNKIDITQCFDYEFQDYDFFPDKEGEPIYFVDREPAVDWVKENIKPDLIAVNSKEIRHIALRHEFLKEDLDD
jgi:hypothetical protein